MKQEVKIVPPDGYEVDKENSTFECVKFKPITPQSKRWRDGNPTVKGWYAGNEVTSYNLNGTDELKWKNGNLNVFATEKQAKSAFAMAQISQIMANDERFGGTITDKEWGNTNYYKSCIIRYGNCLVKSMSHEYHFLAFHNDEQRSLFFEENEDLIKDYLMID